MGFLSEWIYRLQSRKKEKDECWYNNFNERSQDYGGGANGVVPSLNEIEYKQIRQIEKQQVRAYVTMKRQNKR